MANQSMHYHCNYELLAPPPSGKKFLLFWKQMPQGVMGAQRDNCQVGLEGRTK